MVKAPCIYVKEPCICATDTYIYMYTEVFSNINPVATELHINLNIDLHCALVSEMTTKILVIKFTTYKKALHATLENFSRISSVVYLYGTLVGEMPTKKRYSSNLPHIKMLCRWLFKNSTRGHRLQIVIYIENTPEALSKEWHIYWHWGQTFGVTSWFVSFILRIYIERFR